MTGATLLGVGGFGAYLTQITANAAAVRGALVLQRDGLEVRVEAGGFGAFLGIGGVPVLSIALAWRQLRVAERALRDATSAR